MKQKVKIMTFVLVFLFLFITSSALSQPGMGMRRWRGEDQCSRASDFNLSAEQRKNLELFQQAYFREAQLLRLRIFTKKLEMRELLTNSAVKIDVIRSKNSEITELQSKQEEQSLEYLIKVRNLLTPEQLKTWCPDQEFPYFFRQTMPGRRPMGPIPPSE